MAGHTLPIPGNRMDRDKPLCIPYGDTLEIPFSATGILSSDNPGAFSPPLPAGGFVDTSEIGPYKANDADSDIHLKFIEEGGTIYTYTVLIKPSCQ
jgi:hypothetical protein